MVLTLASLSLFVGGCSSKDKPPQDTNNSEETANPTSKPRTEQKYKVVADHLQEPWEIVLYDNVFYISERTGSIVKVDDGTQTRKKVQFTKDLANQPEAGLLGMAFPKNFAKTNTAYAYYSYQEDNAFYQRVVLIEEQETHWQEKKVLLDHIPGGEFHQGGRIKIGPDNKLYITTGDAKEPELAQNLDSLAGKILRMNLDGSFPSDNPYENSYVYSYGHRNPQGLAWDTNGNLYASEHGESAHDEINLIEKGSNYGWPIIQGDESAEGMESPIVQSGDETWAPSGMVFFRGFFYFASLRGEGLRRFNQHDGSVDLIISDVGRIRDVLGSDDGIYMITNNTDGRGQPSKNDDKLIFIPEPKNKLF